MYIIVLLLGSGIMMMYGYPFNDSIFEFASSLGTVGLSVGVTRPDMPPVLLWLQTAGMFLGRLEMFVVIIGSIKIVRDLGIILRRNRSHVIRH
jgi:trk system potassium uptake protein TrkH